MPDRKVKEVIHDLLSNKGLQVNGDLKVKVRFGKDHGLVNVDRFSRFIECFPDTDKICIECYEVVAQNIDDERDFSIGFMWIEIDHSKKSLAVKVVTDEEETWKSDLDYLVERHEKLEKTARDALYLLTLL